VHFSRFSTPYVSVSMPFIVIDFNLLALASLLFPDIRWSTRPIAKFLRMHFRLIAGRHARTRDQSKEITFADKAHRTE
jgi:hypothetical protein